VDLLEIINYIIEILVKVLVRSTPVLFLEVFAKISEGNISNILPT